MRAVEKEKCESEEILFSGSGEIKTESQFENPYLYAGREVDILDSGSLKIQNNRHRSYNYELARWMQADPLGYVDGMNLYQYVNASPVSKTDALGLKEGFMKCYVKVKPDVFAI